MIKAVIFDMYETLVTLSEGLIYFGTQIADDAVIDKEIFLPQWRESETDRTIGKVTFEEVLAKILADNNRYSQELMSKIVEKRVRSKEEAFEHMHPEIIPMLEGLREKGILLGLISNCYSEESAVIKASVLYPYFDAPCLSYDEHLQKPDNAIFLRCLEKLNVRAEECLYVGDGGSNELSAAERVGMKAAQAAWYIKNIPEMLGQIDERFEQMASPLDILKYV